MTDHDDRPVHPNDSRCEDKHGHELHEGDTVRFAYGGNEHEMRVTDITRSPENLVWQLHGSINVVIHAASSARTKKAAHQTPQKSAQAAEKGHETPSKAKDTTPAHNPPKTAPKEAK